MTTYRKDVKEQHALIHVDGYKSPPQLQREYWARTNCLLGFTVISILIGCIALAISILLLLQSFELAGLENVRVAQLEMRVKYLEQLNENQEPQVIENYLCEPEREPPTPPPGPPPPPPSLPPQPPRAPGNKPPITEEEKPRPVDKEENEIPADADSDPEPNLPPYNPPIDDDEDSYSGFEGSGDDCPYNPPRPTCPFAMRVCLTKERCPKYVCCR